MLHGYCPAKRFLPYLSWTQVANLPDKENTVIVLPDGVSVSGFLNSGTSGAPGTTGSPRSDVERFAMSALWKAARARETSVGTCQD